MRVWHALPLIVAVLAAGTWVDEPAAEQAAVTPAVREDVSRRVEELKTRLKLTPEQEVVIRPLMQDEAEKLRAIREKHAGDTSRHGRMEMLREAKPVQQEFQRKLGEILTPEQLEEWSKIEQETRERMREKARQRKAQTAP